MGIKEKIEEIRQKPEHIRIRYVWALVAICMVFVIIIWVISLKAQNNSNTGAEIKSPLDANTLNELQDQKKSLEDSVGNLKKGLENGAAAGEKNPEGVAPNQNTDPNPPRTQDSAKQ